MIEEGPFAIDCLTCADLAEVTPCEQYGMCPYRDEDFDEKLIEKLNHGQLAL